MLASYYLWCKLYVVDTESNQTSIFEGVNDYVMQYNESLGMLRLIFPLARAGRWPVIG